MGKFGEEQVKGLFLEALEKDPSAWAALHSSSLNGSAQTPRQASKYAACSSTDHHRTTPSSLGRKDAWVHTSVVNCESWSAGAMWCLLSIAAGEEGLPRNTCHSRIS